MKKIMLVCSAGMSTSLLVTKMETAAKDQGLNLEIFAVAEADAGSHFDDISILLLGPQVRYLKAKLTTALESRGVPVQVIDTLSYGTMNGKAVLDKALADIK